MFGNVLLKIIQLDCKILEWQRRAKDAQRTYGTLRNPLQSLSLKNVHPLSSEV
jgi:hypothetical protein